MASRFQLNKDEEPKAKRSFNLKKEDEPTQVLAPAEPEKSGKSWIWIVVIAILALLVWWMWPKTAEEPVAEEVAVEEVAETTAEEPVVEETTATPESDAQATPEAVAEEVAQPVAPVAAEPVSAAPAVSADIEAEALKVIRGDYGVGQERKDRLGAQYAAIQGRVNELKREGKF